MTADLFASLMQTFGAPGCFIAYMIWDRTRQGRVDRDRIAADLETAKAMTLLAERISHVR